MKIDWKCCSQASQQEEKAVWMEEGEKITFEVYGAEPQAH